MDVSRAQVANLGESVVFCDPEWPWTIQASVMRVDGRPVVDTLTVTATGNRAITSSVLSQIPVRQITRVVASLTAGEGEAQYRMLATPKPAGNRSWPPDHFRRVASVARWARATGRPGGAAEAVAEFWGVHYRTARRWISQCPAADRPSPQNQTSPDHDSDDHPRL